MVVALVMAAALLAGCGGSSSSGSSNSSSAATSAASGSSTGSTSTAGSGSSNIQATAAKLVAKYEKLPPASAYPKLATFNPGQGSVAVLACSFANDCGLSGEQAVDAFHAMGWKSGPAQNGAYSTASWSAFMQRAASQHLNGVVLIGIDVNTISAAVHQAASAGVKIACIFCQSGPQWKGEVYDVGPNLRQMGQIAALKAIATYGTKLKLVDFTDPATDALVQRHAGVAATVKKYCPSCSLNTVTVPAADFSKPGPPEWDAYLEAHPQGTVNYVIGPFDDVDNAIAKTDQSSGRSITIGGYGLSGAIPFLQNGQEQSIVTYGYGYYGWMAADVLARLKAHLPLPADLTNLPVMLITHSNVATVADNHNAGHYITPPGNWQQTYLTAWGKK
jgi:ABC-type sugar transport system substrate-binding protein